MYIDLVVPCRKQTKDISFEHLVLKQTSYLSKTSRHPNFWCEEDGLSVVGFSTELSGQREWRIGSRWRFRTYLRDLNIMDFRVGPVINVPVNPSQ